MIKLTQLDDRAFLVEPDFIKAIQELAPSGVAMPNEIPSCPPRTRVDVNTVDRYVLVKESPEQILELIKEAKNIVS